MTSHEEHAHRILTELAAGAPRSQRLISQNLGIALGLTNLLIRRFVRKGWVRMVHVRPNRFLYLLTPAGMAEKSRMTRAYLDRSIRFYATARDRILERFAVLSEAWPSRPGAAPDGDEPKRILFYGAGEVAEVGYICLQHTDLSLVGVVDDKAKDQVRKFFDVPVYSHRQLGRLEARGVRYDVLVVMSFTDDARITKRLTKHGIAQERVFWI
ncbi:MAG: winged helix-turn-helix transcriptional regulator [Acidobacteriota bacterium]